MAEERDPAGLMTARAAAPFTILLDLDGTLVDPAVGILTSYRHALTALGRPVDEEADLNSVIGPPLRVSFAQLLGEGGDTEAAVAHYRTRYAAGALFEAHLYPGIPEALERLSSMGFRLLICTSKAHVYARRIVEHFGIARLLSGVYGAELDGRHDDKGDLIAHIIETEGLCAGETVMVGDRKHDVIGAARHGIPCIGAAWGYGSPAELTEAGATLLIDTPANLPEACRILASAAHESTQ
jgi:phosphoglycolate phosphatase